jgi:hypothetical protein
MVLSELSILGVVNTILPSIFPVPCGIPCVSTKRTVSGEVNGFEAMVATTLLL